MSPPGPRHTPAGVRAATMPIATAHTPALRAGAKLLWKVSSQNTEGTMRAGTLWAIAISGMLLAGVAGAEGKNPMILMSTSMGDVKIELYEDKAPVTVKNFLSYVNDKFYDGTIFHRVIPN